MLDFSWKVFSMTGNVDTYLLMKEIENDEKQLQAEDEILSESSVSDPGTE